MPVEFSSFPNNWRLPLWWLEVDSSEAGLPTQIQPALMVGQMFSTGPNAGTAVLDVPIAVGSKAEATGLFGAGSMLDRMFSAFFDNNFAELVYGLPIADPVAGVAAHGSLNITHAPTDAGTLDLYIAGQDIPILVLADDTATDVAAAIVAAINAQATLPVTAAIGASGASSIALTCKWKGATGNDITVLDSYLGIRGAQQRPQGLTISYANAGRLIGGTGVPIFDNAIANIYDQDYEYVALPYTDTGSMNVWNTEFGFGDNGRWGWMRQQYGSIFGARRDSYSGHVIWGQVNNSPVQSTMAFEILSPSPAWEWAASYCSKAGRALLNDPARPLQTLELESILPAPKHMTFLLPENNAIAGYGLAVQKTSPNGVPLILVEASQYQKNIYGVGDDAWFVITTLHTLARLFRNQRHAITNKYPRVKLCDDGTRYGVGQKMVSPSVIKAELIAEYAVDEFNGLVENHQAFKDHLIVERDPNNPNRISVLYPPDIVNQLRIFSVLGQFRLQYSRGLDQLVSA
jgi:phage tail sheath gpL-like